MVLKFIFTDNKEVVKLYTIISHLSLIKINSRVTISKDYWNGNLLLIINILSLSKSYVFAQQTLTSKWF